MNNPPISLDQLIQNLNSVAVLLGRMATYLENAGGPVLLSDVMSASSTPVAKAWAYVTVAAGVPTLQAGYNISSIVDTDTGRLTLNFTTPFATANWVGSVSVTAASNAAAEANRRLPCIANGGQAAGSVELNCWDGTGTTSNLVDPAAWHFVAFGAQ